MSCLAGNVGADHAVFQQGWPSAPNVANEIVLLEELIKNVWIKYCRETSQSIIG